MSEIIDMMMEIPVLSEIQKKFFTAIISYRYEKVLLPVYQKLKEREEIRAIEEPNAKKGRCR